MTRKIMAFSLALAFWSGAAGASEGPELASYMRTLQYFAHKTGLSIDAQNRRLAGFYMHELEEVLESVGKIGDYEGHSIGALSAKILEPVFHELEETVDQGRWDDASSHYDALLDACNRCHQATDHGFVRIERSGKNPYMQSFD